jgi:sulfonate transport system substrate-binding protein
MKRFSARRLAAGAAGPASFVPMLLLVLSVFAVSVAGADGPAPSAASAPEPAGVPPGTTLTVGDPITQQALELTGAAGRLPFRIVWANMSGGPLTTAAFRAHALDLGEVADIPPIFATWTGEPVKIVAVQFRAHALDHPVYVLGVAPGAGVRTLSDLRGRKIAYSPGQAQGALVLRILRKAGLGQGDVTLVELPSTGDVYANALASRLVDVAPLGEAVARHYLAMYGRQGASVIAHGLRDDALYLYAPVEVLQDPAKAAAIRAYVRAWCTATDWAYAHPAQWSQAYYVRFLGLSESDARFLVSESGEPQIPASWNEAIAREQATIDLLSAAQHWPRLRAADLFDRRFEGICASAPGSGGLVMEARR